MSESKFSPEIEAAMRAAGIWGEETEPWTSLDEMHASPPFAPATADPFSEAAAYDPDEEAEEDEMTIDRDGVVRRNGLIEPPPESVDP